MKYHLLILRLIDVAPIGLDFLMLRRFESSTLDQNKYYLTTNFFARSKSLLVTKSLVNSLRIL